MLIVRTSSVLAYFASLLESLICAGFDSKISRRDSQALGLSGYRYSRLLNDGKAVQVNDGRAIRFFFLASDGLRVAEDAVSGWTSVVA